MYIKHCRYRVCYSVDYTFVFPSALMLNFLPLCNDKFWRSGGFWAVIAKICISGNNCSLVWKFPIDVLNYDRCQCQRGLYLLDIGSLSQRTFISWPACPEVAWKSLARSHLSRQLLLIFLPLSCLVICYLLVDCLSNLLITCNLSGDRPTLLTVSEILVGFLHLILDTCSLMTNLSKSFTNFFPFDRDPCWTSLPRGNFWCCGRK